MSQAMRQKNNPVRAKIMLYTVSWAIMLVACLCLLTACHPKELSPISTALPLTFTSEKWSFSIRYPQDWVIDPESLASSQNTSNYGNQHVPVMFFGNNSKGEWKCVVSIMVMDLSKMNQTFEEWIRETLKEAVKIENTTLSGYPAYRAYSVDKV